jgi:hypothetical protein
LLSRLRAVVEAKDAENAVVRRELDAEQELRGQLALRPAELERRLSMDSSDSGTQARAEGPDPARARRAPPSAPRDVRRSRGRAAVPLRERQPAPAVHVVAGMAESPGRLANPEQLA